MRQYLRSEPELRNLAVNLSTEEQAVMDGASTFLRAVMAYASKLTIASQTAGVAVVAEDAFVGLVTKATAARALAVSVSTIDRFVREGAPSHTIGGRRRFDTGELIAWANARGQKAPSAKTIRDSVDVDDVARRAGLRLVDGAGK